MNLSNASYATRPRSTRYTTSTREIAEMYIAHDWRRRCQSTRTSAATGFRCRANTKWRRVCRAQRTSGNVAWQVAPHFAAGLSDVFFRDVDVQIRPQSPKAAPRSFRGVLALERVHKIQPFFPLLRGSSRNFSRTCCSMVIALRLGLLDHTSAMFDFAALARKLLIRRAVFSGEQNPRHPAGME
jgi:hypothetical protein